MARLDEAPPSTSSSSEGVHTATEIAHGLSNPNPQLKQKINELFGRKQRYTESLPKLANKQKNHPSKPVHRKKITVVCVDNKTFSIPTRKARDKLVEEGKIREVYIGNTETKSVIIEKIRKLFPTSGHQLLLLKTTLTSAKDLIPAFSDEDEEGCDIGTLGWKQFVH